MRIRRVWDDKDVDPKLVLEQVDSYLKGKGFVTKSKEKNNQFTIFAKGRTEDGSHVEISAKVFRNKNELFVELSAGEQNVLQKFDGLTSLVLGGYVTLQKLKAEEVLEKLEPDFYRYIDQVVLNQSTKNQSKVG